MAKKISKTKIGATLIGLGVILGALGNSILGNTDLTNAVIAILEGIGGILTAWGIRDWPIINKKR